MKIELRKRKNFKVLVSRLLTEQLAPSLGSCMPRQVDTDRPDMTTSKAGGPKNRRAGGHSTTPQTKAPHHTTPGLARTAGSWVRREIHMQNQGGRRKTRART